MDLIVNLSSETDGRVIADVPALPGVCAYGATREEASKKACVLALRVLAHQVESGELQVPLSVSISGLAS